MMPMGMLESIYEELGVLRGDFKELKQELKANAQYAAPHHTSAPRATVVCEAGEELTEEVI